ncbi:MAG: hypothetical protein Q9222_001588 [Ikaeria aurantiellina]
MSDGASCDADGVLGDIHDENLLPQSCEGEALHSRSEAPQSRKKPYNENASIIDYDDKDELLNSELQLIFDQHAQIGRQSSWLYGKVSVLLISWAVPFDDLNTMDEVNSLEKVLGERYNYNIRNIRLKNEAGKLPQAQVNKQIADFVYDEDGPSSLLLVYYAGHGTPGHRPGQLELAGNRNPTVDVLDTVVWNLAEAALQQTQADVLEIFDCCYAGDLFGRSRGFGTRCFEFLGATSSGNTTKIPGPSSFTRGLIWALDRLAKESGRFTTTTLANKIKEALHFPPKQVPVLYERNDVSSPRRIVIAPLLQGEGMSKIDPVETDDSISQHAWGFLDIRFSLEQLPRRNDVENFAKNLKMMMQTTDLKVQNVKWAGLCSSSTGSGIHSSIVKKAVRTFLSLGKRAKTRGQHRRTSSTDLSTPSSPTANAFDSVPLRGRAYYPESDSSRHWYDNEFEPNDKVWQKNPATGFYEWSMTVVEKRYRNSKPGWEYKVKYGSDQLYDNGAWVAEKDLRDAA